MPMHSLVILGCGTPHSLSSRGLSTGSRLWELSQRDPYRIHWIAAVALLPRDDKKCITLTLSCHCEPSQMAWQSSQLTCRAVTPRPLVIPWLSFLCHPGAFFSLSSRGQNAPHKNIRFCGGPAHQDDKKNSEYQKPAHDNFCLARYVANK